MTYWMAEKFRMGGRGLNLSINYQIRVALLVGSRVLQGDLHRTNMLPTQRRFIMENMWKDWVATENDEAGSDNDEAEPPEPVSKKRKGIGKVGKGEDFWSRVEKWLTEKI